MRRIQFCHRELIACPELTRSSPRPGRGEQGKSKEMVTVVPLLMRVDWYQNPPTKACQPIPRHREIKEHLARHILRKLQD